MIKGYRADGVEFPEQYYAIGIGSNRPLSRKLTPRTLVGEAIIALGEPPLYLVARSTIITSAPVGPSLRTYANAAAVIATQLAPRDLLALLQAIEARFGRRRYRRWGARTLDLDILLWSGGSFRSRRLIIPHPAIRDRLFVLRPLCEIAPHWRDPHIGLSARQIAARATNGKRPVLHLRC